MFSEANRAIAVIKSSKSVSNRSVKYYTFRSNKYIAIIVYDICILIV